MSENIPTVNDTSEPFATPELIYECLTIDDLIDVIGTTEYNERFSHLAPESRPQTLGDIIGVTEPEDFYAECVYLNHWDTQLNHALIEDGTDIDYRPLSEDGKTLIGVEISFFHQDRGVFFHYQLNPDHPNGYDLQIIDTNDNCVYWRQAGQDPRTEWIINGMADGPDYVDAEGNIAFTSNPTNI